jgi:hypothetical protein
MVLMFLSFKATSSEICSWMMSFFVLLRLLWCSPRVQLYLFTA